MFLNGSATPTFFKENPICGGPRAESPTRGRGRRTARAMTDSTYIAPTPFLGSRIHVQPRKEPAAAVVSLPFSGLARPIFNMKGGLCMETTDKDGLTKLHWAVANNDFDVCRRLLEAGANPNLADPQGRTPLHIAAQRGQDDNLPLIQLLIDFQADPFQKDITGKAAIDYGLKRP